MVGISGDNMQLQPDMLTPVLHMDFLQVVRPLIYGGRESPAVTRSTAAPGSSPYLPTCLFIP